MFMNASDPKACESCWLKEPEPTSSFVVWKETNMLQPDTDFVSLQDLAEHDNNDYLHEEEIFVRFAMNVHGTGLKY